MHLYNLEKDSSNTKVEEDVFKQRWFKGPPGPNGYARITNQDVFLFRLGYFDYMKLNVEPMVRKSEAEKWYSIDMIIDWDN